MARVKSKTYFLKILLVAIATSFAFLAIAIPENQIAFWTASWGNLTHGEAKIPLIIGVIPFSNLSLFLSFLFIYLFFEFYGLKGAIYTSWIVPATLLLHFFLFVGVQKLLLLNPSEQVVLSVTPFSHLNQDFILALSLAYAAGLTGVFMMAWLVQKLTKNYFMFLRFVLGTLFGFTIFVLFKNWFIHSETLAPISILLHSLTPVLQFVGLSLLAIVVLYILRLFLGFFSGKTKPEDDDENLAQNNIFKSSSPAIVANEDDIETTQSHKESFIEQTESFSTEDFDPEEEITHDSYKP